MCAQELVPHLNNIHVSLIMSFHLLSSEYKINVDLSRVTMNYACRYNAIFCCHSLELNEYSVA